MKKIKRIGMLSLTLVLVFMFTAAFIEIAAADDDHAFTQGIQIQIQARHDNNNRDNPLLHLNKNELTLNKGQSYTLKAHILPSRKSVSVKWISSNPKIAKVSSSGKVTAIAPGSVRIKAESNEYTGSTEVDKNGYSDECYITVLGDAKDIKPIGMSDWTYNYGKFTFTAVANKQIDALAKIKKSIGGHTSYGHIYGIFLELRSKAGSKTHTVFCVDNHQYFFIAREESPIKTNRGIMVGAKKSKVLQKYGLPTFFYQDEMDDKTYELIYTTKAPGKNLYTQLTFVFLKSNDTVNSIRFYLGVFGY